MCQSQGNEKTTKLRQILQVNGCQDKKLERHLKIVSCATMLPRKTLASRTTSKELKWTAHINIVQVVAKSNRMLWFLKRHCSLDLNKESLKQLCISLLHSNLCYVRLVALGVTVSYMDAASRKYPKESFGTRFICKTLNFHTRTDFWTLTSYLFTTGWNT